MHRKILVVDGLTPVGAYQVLRARSDSGAFLFESVVPGERWGRYSMLGYRPRGSLLRDLLGFSRLIDVWSQLGVPLHEEPGGKLFPDSNRSRDVLEALLAEARRAGVELRASHRVTDLSTDRTSFRVATTGGAIAASRVVLATGGLSLPKTGSDGTGYRFATQLGHTVVPTTPALVPLVLERDAIAPQLGGVSHPVRLDVRTEGRVTRQVTGALLWTHFGVSGPAALDVSRHWLRERLAPTAACPGFPATASTASQAGCPTATAATTPPGRRGTTARPWAPAPGGRGRGP